jgi:peptide/nickel transport system substrate-binding protein
MVWGTLTAWESYNGPYTSGSVQSPNWSAFWDTLTKFGQDSMTPEPHLAEAWEFNADQTELKVTLREGLEFHNGKPINAEAVKGSFENITAEGTNNSQVKGTFGKYVSSIDVVDDRTLNFNLAWPGPLIFDVFQYAHVHDPDALAAYTADRTDPGGFEGASGPFKFDLDGFRAGESFRGVRHEAHYEPTLVDSIEFRVFQDASVLGLALDAGEIHGTNNATSADGLRWQNDDNLTVDVAPPGLAMWVMGMVTTGRGGGHPALDDARVRRALYMAVDRKRLAEETFQGLKDPVEFFWQPFSEAYDPDLDREHFDLDAAKALIDESGWAGETIELSFSSGGDPADDSIAAVIQADAAKIGINFEIVTRDGAVQGDLFRSGMLPGAYISSFAFYALQPETLPVMNFQMRIPNSCGYDTPEYQELIDAFGAQPTAAERAALHTRLNTLFAEESWIAPIVSRGYVWAWQKKLQNLTRDILAIPFHSRYWLDEDA